MAEERAGSPNTARNESLVGKYEDVFFFFFFFKFTWTRRLEHYAAGRTQLPSTNLPPAPRNTSESEDAPGKFRFVMLMWSLCLAN